MSMVENTMKYYLAKTYKLHVSSDEAADKFLRYFQNKYRGVCAYWDRDNREVEIFANGNNYIFWW